MEAVRAIAAMSVVTLLMELLAPEGKLKSTIKTIIGIAFLSAVAEPIFRAIT